MSFTRKRRISMGLTSAYFLTSAAVLGYIVLLHAAISCCGVVLLPLTAPLLLYGALAHCSLKNFKTNKNRLDFVDPADFGISIGSARLIRAVGLILPLPFLAYGWFFASGLSWVGLDGSPASVARTYAVVAFDERFFGHRMAQREFRRAARIYAFKRNYSLAKMFIGSAIQCAEEHTPNKPSRLVDYHTEAGRIAARAHEWSLAESEFTTALSIAKGKLKLDDKSRIVRRLTRRLSWLHAKHPESITIQLQAQSYQPLCR
jgi:hypothetical protein